MILMDVWNSESTKKKNREKNKVEEWKERKSGGKLKIGLNLIY